MKRVLILFVVFILSSVLFWGCKKILDVAPDGNLTMEDVYKDPIKVEALLAAIYSGLPQKGFVYVEFTPLFTAITDDGWEANGEFDGVSSYRVYHNGNTSTWHTVANAVGGNGITQKNYWADFYASIRLCNQFLENVDKMAFESPDKKKRMIAEAHVLRAYYYTDLIKLFGAVPKIDRVLSLDADFSVLERNSVHDIAKFIEADCDFAIGTAELPWRITSGELIHNNGGGIANLSGESFRVTKALAYTLKATALLFAASPLHSGGSNHWEEAYNLSKQAVDALRQNGYELFTVCTQPSVFGTGGAAALHELMCKIADYSSAPRDRETIYQTVSATWVGSLLWHANYVGTQLPGNAYVGTTPTQELVDAFEYVSSDGTTSYPLLNLANPYSDEQHLQPNFNSAAITAGYSEATGSDPYSNRDPRLHITMLHNGDTINYPGAQDPTVPIDAYIGDSAEGVTNGIFAISTDPKDRGRTKTGYFYSKTITPGMSAQGNPMTPTYKHYRFAELLLDLAETANETGRTSEALAALNEVRARVGMPDITVTDPDQLRLRIHNERRVEFAFEENRYYDLRRWCSPTGDLGKVQKYLTAMWITKHKNGTFSYERKNVWTSERGGWTNRDLLLPLPLSEVSRLEPLTGKQWQNPGW
jgi:hypothetical protein